MKKFKQNANKTILHNLCRLSGQYSNTNNNKKKRTGDLCWLSVVAGEYLKSRFCSAKISCTVMDCSEPIVTGQRCGCAFHLIHHVILTHSRDSCMKGHNQVHDLYWNSDTTSGNNKCNFCRCCCCCWQKRERQKRCTRKLNGI